MSATVNKVIMIGNLGEDPKVVNFDGGGKLVNLSIATSETYTDKTTEEKVERTDWHNLVFKNKLAEIAEQYLKKGNKIYLEGKIRTRKYTQDDVDKYTTEIIVDSFQFLDSKNNEDTPTE